MINIFRELFSFKTPIERALIKVEEKTHVLFYYDINIEKSKDRWIIATGKEDPKNLNFYRLIKMEHLSFMKFLEADKISARIYQTGYHERSWSIDYSEFMNHYHEESTYMTSDQYHLSRNIVDY